MKVLSALFNGEQEWKEAVTVDGKGAVRFSWIGDDVEVVSGSLAIECADLSGVASNEGELGGHVGVVHDNGSKEIVCRDVTWDPGVHHRDAGGVEIGGWLKIVGLCVEGVPESEELHCVGVHIDRNMILSGVVRKTHEVMEG